MGALALPALDDMGDVRASSSSSWRGPRSRRPSTTASWARAAATRREESLYLDFPYLVLYGLFYAAACLVVAARAAERGMAAPRALGAPARAGAALAAAACDAIENVALLRVLDGHTDQPWPGIAFTFASVKFAADQRRDRSTS